MGRKRNRERQHLLFYTSCILIACFSTQGCVHLSEALLEKCDFEYADFWMNQRDYEAALRENERIFERNSDKCGDQALYRIGLIYAHPENRFGDVQKATQLFDSIPDRYPQSPVRVKARLWVLTLTKMDGYRKTISSMEEEMSLLAKRLENKEKKNDLLKRKMKELESKKAQSTKKELPMEPVNSPDSEAEVLEQNRLLKERIKELESQIEGLKKIDLRIEEKKTRESSGEQR